MAVKAHIQRVTRTACGGARHCGAPRRASRPAAEAAAAPGGGSQSAADFIGQVTTQFSRGQSGRLWDTLHPADQAIVNRARYMACQSNSGFDLKKLKVIETYADTVDIAGRSTPSTAISVRVTVGRRHHERDHARRQGQRRVALDPAAGRLRRLQTRQVPFLLASHHGEGGCRIIWRMTATASGTVGFDPKLLSFCRQGRFHRYLLSKGYVSFTAATSNRS